MADCSGSAQVPEQLASARAPHQGCILKPALGQQQLTALQWCAWLPVFQTNGTKT